MKLKHLHESLDINKTIQERYRQWMIPTRGRPPELRFYLSRGYNCKLCPQGEGIITVTDIPDHLREHGIDIPFDPDIEGEVQRLNKAIAAQKEKKPATIERFVCTQPRGAKSGVMKCGNEFQRYTCMKCGEIIPPITVHSSFGNVECPYCHNKRKHGIDIVDRPGIKTSSSGVMDRRQIIEPKDYPEPPRARL